LLYSRTHSHRLLQAFAFLSAFRNKYPLFNDDIQGTGAVVLSGFMNAAKLSSAASGRPLTDHKIVFLGAGSAGVGVGMQLMSYFKLHGMSEQEARERIYLVDSQGLIYDGRGPMAEHKKCKGPS
jgi:malate dehydrogenase (oxaloacetate-decarboxylating)(NADP+)